MLANEPDKCILYLYHSHKIAHWQAAFLMAPLSPLTLLQPSARLATGSSPPRSNRRRGVRRRTSLVSQHGVLRLTARRASVNSSQPSRRGTDQQRAPTAPPQERPRPALGPPVPGNYTRPPRGRDSPRNKSMGDL